MDKNQEREHQPEMTEEEKEMLERVSNKEERKKRARERKKSSIWYGLSVFGIVGWMVIVPTLIGVAIGLWLDSITNTSFSWTLTLMLGGLLIGCINAFSWAMGEQKEIERERKVVEEERKQDE